jgi:hypothetical protein
VFPFKFDYLCHANIYLAYFFSHFFSIQSVGSLIPNSESGVPKLNNLDLQNFARKLEHQLYWAANNRVSFKWNILKCDRIKNNIPFNFSKSRIHVYYNIYFIFQTTYYHLISERIYKLQMNIKKNIRQPTTQPGGERQPVSNSLPSCIERSPFVQRQLRLGIPFLVFPHVSLSTLMYIVSYYLVVNNNSNIICYFELLIHTKYFRPF